MVIKFNDDGLCQVVTASLHKFNAAHLKLKLK